jgi:hypothetical protein
MALLLAAMAALAVLAFLAALLMEAVVEMQVLANSLVNN